MKTNSILIASRSATISKLVRFRCENIGFTGNIFTATTTDELPGVLKNREPNVLLLEACFFHYVTDRKIQFITEKYMTRVVVYTIAPCGVYTVVRFFRCGADSYINIRDGIDAYEKMLRRIIQGKSIVPDIVLNSKRDLYRLPPKNINVKLRDKEIMELVATGIGNEKISGILGIAKRTVKNRRYMLYEKLGCNNLAELIRKLVRNNIIDKQKYCGCPDCGYSGNEDTKEYL